MTGDLLGKLMPQTGFCCIHYPCNNRTDLSFALLDILAHRIAFYSLGLAENDPGRAMCSKFERKKTVLIVIIFITILLL